MNGILRTALLAAAAASTACASSGGTDLSGMSFTDDPLVGKVIWNELLTDNGEVARRFYRELFGWTFETSESATGGPYLLARDGDVYVAGILPIAAQQRDEYSRWLPYVSVRDLNLATERARTAGGEVVVSPRNVEIGRVAAIIDPEGAVIGLATSDIGDPDDATTGAAPGRVVWHELLSDDPVAATEFYRTVVGYQHRTVDRRGGEYRVLSQGGVDRMGILANPTADWDPVWLTMFGVDDAAATASRAERLGATVLLPASPEFRGGTTAVLTDPTGAIFVVRDLN